MFLYPLSSVGKWLFERFREYIVYSNLWVAGGIASLIIAFERLVGLPLDWRPAALAFSAALIPYTLDRIADSYVQEIPDAKAQAFFRMPGIFALVVAATLTFGILLYRAPTAVRYVSCVGILPLLYGIPLFPWRQDNHLHWYRLKDIPGIKAWFVGGIITYACVALPLAYAGQSLTPHIALTTLFLFIFIVTNSHTFDIRDLESDQTKGVLTLPLQIGVRNTKVALTTLNLIVLATYGAGWIKGFIPFQPEVLISISITIAYLWRVQPSTPRPVYSIAIDGSLFIPFLVSISMSMGMGFTQMIF
jgi:4-hydroxybenzoate polyprenyltransferase